MTALKYNIYSKDSKVKVATVSSLREAREYAEKGYEYKVVYESLPSDHLYHKESH